MFRAYSAAPSVWPGWVRLSKHGTLTAAILAAERSSWPRCVVDGDIVRRIAIREGLRSEDSPFIGETVEWVIAEQFREAIVWSNEAADALLRKERQT